MKHRALFIAGTDTGAGKTTVSGFLLKQYAQNNVSLRYWKPVQTGSPPDDDGATVETISGFSRAIPGLRFQQPLSPHRAAELEQREIRLSDLLDRFRDLSSTFDLIVEGAGGICTPLNRTTLWVDFLAASGLSVVLVARTETGTINHSLLSVEALRSRSIDITGLAFCGPDNPDNISTIAQFTGLPLLGRVDPAAGQEQMIDTQGRLAPWFGQTQSGNTSLTAHNCD